MATRRLWPLGALVLVVGILLVGRSVREHLGLDPSPGAIQAWIQGLGWKGPAIFVVALTFRQLLLVPAGVLLTVGGVCFGVALGTVLGSVGITLSAALKFGLVRLVRPHRWRGREADVVTPRRERIGPLFIGVATAYPVGPLSLVHLAAGFSSVSLAAFLVAVVAGAPVRAFVYALFGAALIDGGAGAAGLLALAVALPLAHPAVRQYLLAARR